ncbi:type II secretion system F family protein [Bacillus sp. FJAT-45350]|uniref:type II secretion system F family protein n=1 Tax=Bacillus sp. FJAT-45350 TaxID=2011014 RepID=UPI000BB8EB0F|nr:type II secretion system F family protein [Bacillus sp. FJAT-45350]
MALYQYTGKHFQGRTVKGKMKADSEKDVQTTLASKGIKITEVEEVKSLLHKEITIGERVKSQDFVIYLRQFATLLQAGISVVDTTNILADQTNSKLLKKILKEIEGELQAGRPFSEAAEKHRKVFPSLFINMVKAGEAGGNLDEILDRMAIYFEKQHKTKQKVMSAMSYPLVVGGIAAVIVFFLLTFVVPTFADMFASFGSELPMITQIVMNAGEIFKSFWWLIILAVIGSILLLKFIRDNKATKYYFDYALLRIPIFGKLLQKAALARMTRTLSSLFSSSVPILQAVSIVEKIVGNEVLAKVIRQSRVSLEKGESIAGPMQKHWAFPPLVTQMISVGEKTGALDTMLEKVADFYEDEVDAATDQVKSLIEPLMIVVLAGVVGTIVASIAIPMFQIFDSVG